MACPLSQWKITCENRHGIANQQCRSVESQLAATWKMYSRFAKLITKFIFIGEFKY